MSTNNSHRTANNHTSNNKISPSSLSSSATTASAKDHGSSLLSSSSCMLHSRHKYQYLFTNKSSWIALTIILVSSIFYINSDFGIHVTVFGYYNALEIQDITHKGKIECDTCNMTRQLSILGERNSGTQFLYNHLVDCFNYTMANADDDGIGGLFVSRELTRYKHWFQEKRRSRFRGGTIVLAMFRNPYDWLEAMRKVPHHAPSHQNLNWHDFLTKPWTTNRSGLDLNITNYDDPICQEHFTYNEVVSCVQEPMSAEAYAQINNISKLHYAENHPFYELRNDGSGIPYNSIMELRNDKILNFTNTKSWRAIRDVFIIQYEYLLKYGTKHLLETITEYTNIQPQCQPLLPQTRRRRILHQEMIQYINNNLNWTSEELIGYYPISSNDEYVKTSEAATTPVEKQNNNSIDERQENQRQLRRNGRRRKPESLSSSPLFVL